MEEWKEYKLGDVCSRLRSGKGIKADSVFNSGKYPVIGGNGVRGYADVPNFEGQAAIIGRQGAYCGNVRFFEGEAYMTEHAIVAVGNELADTRFLACLLSLMHLGNLSAQSAQPGISVQTLSKQPIRLPSISYQKKVSAIIKSLDDKIEVNRRINDNLEQQAQALFKSWFVDFEPFRDQPFVESELGMIPEGWRVGTLSEVANITMGASPSGSSYNVNGEGTVFYQGRAEFGYRFPHRNMFTTEPKRYAEEGEVLLSVRAPVGDINIANERCCIGRGLAAIGSKCYPSYILYLVKSLKSVFEQYNGEGTVFGSINKKTLEGLRIIVPEIRYIERFEEIANPLDSQIRCKEDESRRLAELRDTLLPRLMSGELSVDGLKGQFAVSPGQHPGAKAISPGQHPGA